MEKQPNILRVRTFQEMPEEWKEIRRELFALRNESRTEGLDLKRIDDFMREKGLPVKEALIFSDEDLSEILKICESSGLLPDDAFDECFAYYILELELVLLKRQPEKELLNGVIYTESDIIHEKGHASSNYQHYSEFDGGVYVPRAGFGLPNNDQTGSYSSWGMFFEEGFVEMLSGEYKARFSTEKEKQVQFDMFDLPEGFSTDAIEDMVDFADEELPLPIKYSYLEDEESFVTSPSSAAAFGVELLCRKSPELYETMIAARSDLDSLRKIPVLIEKIKPGLYGKLTHLLTPGEEGGEEDFAKGLKIIIDEVYGGKLPLNEKQELDFSLL
jgi:hypothetical protein